MGEINFSMGIKPLDNKVLFDNWVFTLTFLLFALLHTMVRLSLLFVHLRILEIYGAFEYKR